MSRPRDDILSLLNEQEGKAAIAGRQAIIIQPGAIGDCILTLPLAQFMKNSLNLGNVVFLGHLGHAGIFAGRSCIDGVKSIESVAMSRLFLNRREFDVEDNDPLLTAFAPYSWIVTFLGEPDSDFEHNLIYTAHCTHSAEVITLNLKPPAGISTHISNYYIEQFAAALEHGHIDHESPCDLLGVQASACLSKEQAKACTPNKPLITPTEMDKIKGVELLQQFDIDPVSQRLVVIAPGSGSAAKCWPAENFTAVAKQLAATDFKVVFLLGPAEIERSCRDARPCVSTLAPVISDLSLTETLQLLSVCNTFIGNDSGITHLAGAIGAKTVAIFGPTQSSVYRPCGPNVQALQLTPEEFSVVSPKHQEQIAGLIQ
jgi:heptosyltransferase III